MLSKDDLENFQKACEEFRSGTPVATAREELATLARKKERLESIAECDKNDAQIQHQVLLSPPKKRFARNAQTFAVGK
jgi:hypothetical protein